MRFAIYETLKGRAASIHQDPLSVNLLLPAATIARALGEAFDDFAHIANIRLQSNHVLPPRLRQEDRGFVDVLTRMVREGAIRGFFYGVFPNSIRSGLMTRCQMGCYDSFKAMLEAVSWMPSQGTSVQLTASLLSGLVATNVCNQIDVVKTRLMSGTKG